jgi:fatty-acyl-CoA synthase/long-chain acyl-CoA synthetase
MLDESFTLDEVLAYHANHNPDGIVLDFHDGPKITWGEFENLANGYAKALKKTVTKGDIVGVVCGDNLYFHAFIYAIWKNGAGVLLINRTWGIAIIKDLLQAINVKISYCHDKQHIKAFEEISWQEFPNLSEKQNIKFVSQSQPDDIAIIAATSGTTDMPKCVAIRHRQIRYAYKNGLTVHDFNKIHLAASLFPINSLGILGICFLFPREAGVGTKVYPYQAITQIHQSWVDILASDVDFVYLVPPVLRLLSASPIQKKRSTNLLVLCASAPVTEGELKKFELLFPVCVFNCYGLTELTFAVFFGCRDPSGEASGSIGYPVGIECQIVDPVTKSKMTAGGSGELLIRGPMLTDGYLNNLQATTEMWKEGWLHTGDIAESDPQGRYFIRGRLKDAVIRGGVLTYMYEVEHYVRRIPGIIDVVAFKGRELPSGDELILVIQAAEEITVPFIKDWLLVNLGKEKLPNHMFLTKDDLPRNAAGKLNRNYWIELYEKNLLKTHKN